MHRLAELADEVGGVLEGAAAEVLVSDVTHDSRAVRAGSLYVAVRGFTSDGHDFVESAVAAGATAVCVDHALDIAVPQLIVRDTRAALGPLAAAAWDYPSRRFALVGVTGTNGKTTVTHMIEAITTAAGKRTGVIGTVGARVTGGAPYDGFRVPLARTTPEASDLQKLFADMAEAGAEIVLMEVSSHALSLGRVAGTDFALGAFTNLSQDHLDFHETMDAYFEAKASLFKQVPKSVILTDSEWGRRLMTGLAAESGPVAVGLETDVCATDVELYADYSTFRLQVGSETAAVRLPIAGRFNIDNALVAAGCARELEIGLVNIVEGLEALQPVPGRFEHVDSESNLDVVVDYAHTPDSVGHAVAAGRAITRGQLIVVVGAGGDRDHAKRPMMGAATQGADRVFVTSDNPRSEDPDEIIRQVLSGIDDLVNVTVEPDRRSAITSAIAAAQPGDLVMILGKGHEHGQDIGGNVLPFDDRAVARDAMGARS